MKQSKYAGLYWVGDPYTASMIAGEDLSDGMVRTYMDSAYGEIDSQMYGDVPMFDSPGRRPRRKRRGI